MSANSDLEALVCAPDQECGLCLPQYPQGFGLACVSGHCAVELAGP